MHKTLFAVVATAGLAAAAFQSAAGDRPGYTDTPMLPSGKWHVHDSNRPWPDVVTPGNTFSLGAPAPSDAIVLFDGTDFSHWEGDKGAPRWILRDGYMEVVPGTGYIHTKDKFGDVQLHIEFAEPEIPKGTSQERGNSGVFLQALYEVQVLDNYDNPTYADGQCGAIYGQSPPMVNASKKPGEWQSYDICFQAARFGPDHQLVTPAYITILQNGLLIHWRQPILGSTGHHMLAKYDREYPPTGPLSLQEHGNRVRFRNIWIRPITLEEAP